MCLTTGSKMASRRGWCSGRDTAPRQANEFTKHRDQLIKQQHKTHAQGNYCQAWEARVGPYKSNASGKIDYSGTSGQNGVAKNTREHIVDMVTCSSWEKRSLDTSHGHPCDGSGEIIQDPAKILVDALEKWEYPLLTEMSKNVRELKVRLISSQSELAEKHNKQEEALLTIQDQLSEILENHLKPQVEPATEIEQHKSAPLTTLSQPNSRNGIQNSASQTNTNHYAVPDNFLFGPEYQTPQSAPVEKTAKANSESQNRSGFLSRSSQTMNTWQYETKHQTIPPKLKNTQCKKRSKSVSFRRSQKCESLKSHNNTAFLKRLKKAASLKSQNNSASISLSSYTNPASLSSLPDSAPQKISFKTASQRSPPKPVSQRSLSQNASQRSLSKKKETSEPESQQIPTKPASQRFFSKSASISPARHKPQIRSSKHTAKSTMIIHKPLKSVSQPQKQRSLPKLRSQCSTKPASKRDLLEYDSNKPKPKELSSELKTKYSCPMTVEHDFNLVNNMKFQHLVQTFKEENKKNTTVGEQLPPLPPIRLPVTIKPNDILPRRETNHNIEKWLISQRNEYLLEKLTRKLI